MGQSPGSLRDRFTPWTEPDPAVLERWVDHHCDGCDGVDCPEYNRLSQAWKDEVRRAKDCPPTVADRQLQRLGVDPGAFHRWRAGRGLPPFASLAMPDQERVFWWLMRRGSPI